MNAIRIDGEETIRSPVDRHLLLLREYQRREKLTDDQIDLMFDQGRIEFGGMAWNSRERKLYFWADETRARVYTSLGSVIEESGE
jgi:hypothetical protein